MSVTPLHRLWITETRLRSVVWLKNFSTTFEEQNLPKHVASSSPSLRLFILKESKRIHSATAFSITNTESMQNALAHIDAFESLAKSSSGTISSFASPPFGYYYRFLSTTRTGTSPEMHQKQHQRPNEIVDEHPHKSMMMISHNNQKETHTSNSHSEGIELEFLVIHQSCTGLLTSYIEQVNEQPLAFVHFAYMLRDLIEFIQHLTSHGLLVKSFHPTQLLFTRSQILVHSGIQLRFPLFLHLIPIKSSISQSHDTDANLVRETNQKQILQLQQQQPPSIFSLTPMFPESAATTTATIPITASTTPTKITNTHSDNKTATNTLINQVCSLAKHNEQSNIYLQREQSFQLKQLAILMLSILFRMSLPSPTKEEPSIPMSMQEERKQPQKESPALQLPPVHQLKTSTYAKYYSLFRDIFAKEKVDKSHINSVWELLELMLKGESVEDTFQHAKLQTFQTQSTPTSPSSALLSGELYKRDPYYRAPSLIQRNPNNYEYEKFVINRQETNVRAQHTRVLQGYRTQPTVTLIERNDSMSLAIFEKKPRLFFQRYITQQIVDMLRTQQKLDRISDMTFNLSDTSEAIPNAMRLAGMAISGLQYLKYLYLDFETGWRKASLENLHSMLMSLPSLHSLQVLRLNLNRVGSAYLNFADNAVNSICNAIIQLPQLLNITLDLEEWISLRHRDIEKIVTAIQLVVQIREIDLSFNHIVTKQSDISLASMDEFSNLLDIPFLMKLKVSFSGWGIPGGNIQAKDVKLFLDRLGAKAEQVNIAGLVIQMLFNKFDVNHPNAFYSELEGLIDSSPLYYQIHLNEKKNLSSCIKR